MATKISAGTTTGTALSMSADTTGILQLATGAVPTTAITIDASQNVGVGVTSPLSKFQVNTGTDKNFAIASGGFLTDGINITSKNDAGSANVGMQFGGSNFAWTSTGTEQMRIATDGVLSFNSGYGSSAKAYGCRAWVNFNGTGTVAIRASGNVSSITDNGTGDYTVNFTTAMVDANYNFVGMTESNTTYANTVLAGIIKDYSVAPTTSALRIRTAAAAGSFVFIDPAYACVSVFR